MDQRAAFDGTDAPPIVPPNGLPGLGFASRLSAVA